MCDKRQQNGFTIYFVPPEIEPLMEGPQSVHSTSYRVKVGEPFLDLPIVPIGENLAIAFLMTIIDTPISVIENAAKRIGRADCDSRG
jgi:hypothetical protein